MDKKTRFELRLTAAERLRLSALSAQSKLSESEVLRTLIVSGSVIEVDKNQKIESILDDMNHALSTMVDAVTTRLEAIESVIVDALSSTSDSSLKQPSNETVQAKNSDIELPTFEEFCKQFTAPLMPSQIEAFREQVKQEYFKKYQVFPAQT